MICDELAFWFQDTTYANPDTEVLNAVRPGLLTTRGPLILASSVYGKSGELWNIFRKHHGPNGVPAILVAYGTSRDFNETLPQDEIDRALAADPARNAAEYLGQWRTDIETFVSRELVECCVGDYVELAPAASTCYYGFADPSGGSGSDSFALAISHRDGQQVIIDAVREIRPPFLPTAAVEQLVALLKGYRVTKVCGDKWGGGFVQEQFQRAGIRYEQSVEDKSAIYAATLPMINSGRLTLPRNERLVHQLASLERTTAFGSGRERIDHPREMHDDLANAVCGAALQAGSFGGYDWTMSWVRGPDKPEPAEPSPAERAVEELMRRYGQPPVWRVD